MVSVNVFVPQTVLRDYPPPVGCRKNSSLNLAFLLSFIFSPLSLKLSFSDKKNNTVLSRLSFCLGYQEAWPNFWINGISFPWLTCSFLLCFIPSWHESSLSTPPFLKIFLNFFYFFLQEERDVKNNRSPTLTFYNLQGRKIGLREVAFAKSHKKLVSRSFQIKTWGFPLSHCPIYYFKLKTISSVFRYCEYWLWHNNGDMDKIYLRNKVLLSMTFLLWTLGSPKRGKLWA